MRIIAGKYKSRKINSGLTAKAPAAKKAPSLQRKEENVDLRPTTDRARESLFNILNNIIDFDGLKCLELFAGTGAVGFELLSRGAATVSFVESSPAQAALIEKTAMELGCAAQAEIKVQNAAGYLAGHKGEFFDLVFADPPYHAADNELWLNALASLKFNVFVFEHGGINVPPVGLTGFTVMDRKTGITNFRIYISDD